ncbi:hypothetical protein B0H11DRAFT_1906466 [Mycena galericulata]|nr:hypothetical protein B0H11DRAFT_1906466 [Mycena galericulata]
MESLKRKHLLPTSLTTSIALKARTRLRVLWPASSIFPNDMPRPKRPHPEEVGVSIHHICSETSAACVHDVWPYGVVGLAKGCSQEKGPLGPKTLCDTCGKRWARQNKVLVQTKVLGSSPHNTAINNPSCRRFKDNIPAPRTRSCTLNARLKLNRKGRAICRIVHPYIGCYDTIARIFGISSRRVLTAVLNAYAKPDNVSLDYDRAGSEFREEYPPIEESDEGGEAVDDFQYPYPPSGSLEIDDVSFQLAEQGAPKYPVAHFPFADSEERSSSREAVEVQEVGNIQDNALHKPKVANAIPYIELTLRPRGTRSELASLASKKRPRAPESDEIPREYTKPNDGLKRATQPAPNVIHTVVYTRLSPRVKIEPRESDSPSSELHARTPGFDEMTYNRARTEEGMLPESAVAWTNDRPTSIVGLPFRFHLPLLTIYIAKARNSSHIGDEAAVFSPPARNFNKVIPASNQPFRSAKLPEMHMKLLNEEGDGGATVKFEQGTKFVGKKDPGEDHALTVEHSRIPGLAPIANRQANKNEKGKIPSPPVPTVVHSKVTAPVKKVNPNQQTSTSADALAIRRFLTNIDGFDLSSWQDTFAVKGIQTMQDLRTLARMEEARLVKTFTRLFSNDGLSELKIILYCGCDYFGYIIGDTHPDEGKQIQGYQFHSEYKVLHQVRQKLEGRVCGVLLRNDGCFNVQADWADITAR